MCVWHLDNRLSFEGIPAAIGKMVALEHFIAARNQLECIPEGICRLYALKRLVLTSNCLVTLPEGIHFLKLEVCLDSGLLGPIKFVFCVLKLMILQLSFYGWKIHSQMLYIIG